MACSYISPSANQWIRRSRRADFAEPFVQSWHQRRPAPRFLWAGPRRPRAVWYRPRPEPSALIRRLLFHPASVAAVLRIGLTIACAHARGESVLVAADRDESAMSVY